MSDFIETYFKEVTQIADEISKPRMEAVVDTLLKTRQAGGRLFFLGVGGSAANCTHAVNDFRKLCGFECYSATDNVSELTARINDEGWEGALAEWLKVSKLNENDCLFILSVGGGNKEKNVSVNLIQSMDLAKERGASIVGIVSRDGGYTAKASDSVVVVPVVNDKRVTPHAEAFQAVVWHMMVSHPKLQINSTKW